MVPFRSARKVVATGCEVLTDHVVIKGDPLAGSVRHLNPPVIHDRTFRVPLC